MQITDVPQRKGMGTRPHSYPQHYRGHPQPPLFLPGIQPRSQLSSLSYGWCGLAFSIHLGMRGSEYCPLGFPLDTLRSEHLQVNHSLEPGSTGFIHHGYKGLMFRAHIIMSLRHRHLSPTHRIIADPQKMLPPHAETRSSPCAGSNISTVLTKWGRE